MTITAGQAASSVDQVDVDDRQLDPDWDAFVERTPGGHHVQTSLWAQVKAVVGWSAARVIVRRDGSIVGGCQVLLRELPAVGSIAYAPRGPLAADRRLEVLDMILAGLAELAGERRIVLLKLQPPVDRHDMVADLLRAGFKASKLQAGPVATVRIDLQRPPDDILAQMRKDIRHNIRRAQRSELVVRAGGDRDLPSFQRLLELTSGRQGFAPYPAAYFEQMWRLFAPGGHARLILVELDGSVQSALLVIGYGDTVINKMGAWSGARSRVRPNELAHWHAIQWAHERGFRFYDLEGIAPAVGEAIHAGRPVPADERPGVTQFKLGFGGEVALFPDTHDYRYRPVTGAVLASLAPRLEQSHSLVHKLLGRRTP